MAEHRIRPSSDARGFTLIELMVTVVVVALLAAVAYPTFVDAIRKSRRADAVAALAQVQHAQERFRANSATYSGVLGDAGLKLPADSQDGHYSIAVNNANTVSYVATATAKAGSPQAADARCQVLTITLNDVNGLVRRSSTDSGGVVNSSAANPCWVK